jgi:hypothetical protein
MEARLEEKGPTSVDRKPEAAQQEEVPLQDAEVMPVGEPKKKRRRDRKMAGELRTPEENGRHPQWVEPPWESNFAHEGSRPEDAPSRDSGTTHQRHLQAKHDPPCESGTMQGKWQCNVKNLERMDSQMETTFAPGRQRGNYES